MARQTLAICVVGVIAAVLAGSAGADKPEREPAVSVPFEFPAGVVCPFPVLAEPAENRQTQTTFANGKVLFTGFFAAQLTNVSNDESITLNASGPVTLTPAGDNLMITSGGPLIFFFFPGDAGPGDVSTGRMYLFHGRTEVLVDPATFAFLSFSSKGTATDLCAVLA